MSNARGKNILEKIKAAGVVGAGGAGFPTHQKLAASVDTILVNGAECEPLLRVDQQIMEKMAGKIIRALKAAMEATGAKKGVIALKGKYKGAIAALTKEAGTLPIKLHILSDVYPAGDEHVTVYEATGKLVPQGGLPLAASCVVINAETLLNIDKALDDTPVTTTYLTITGEIANPVTLSLPVGVFVRDALCAAGCTNTRGFSVIEGGPMMGKVLDDFDVPITKTTKGLIVLPNEHPIIKKRTQSVSAIIRQAKSCCIRCRRCSDLCPRYLLGHRIEPHKIMMTLSGADNQAENAKMALSCSECGLCEQYACVMGLSPRRLNASLKQEFLQHKLKAPLPQNTQNASSLRHYRGVPVKRLTARLGLSRYDVPAPLNKLDFKPEKIMLKLRQHVGAPSLPVVKEGDLVKEGQLVAAIPEKALGANIHASISGVIEQIGSDYILIKAAAVENPSSFNAGSLTAIPQTEGRGAN